MYIFSFLRSLFRPRHILPVIYFVLNTGIIFVLFAFLLPFELHSDTTLNMVFLGLIGVGVNFVFICLSLTPMGEAFWRIGNAIKKQPEAAYAEQWQHVNAVFNEVKQQVMLADKRVSSKVNLYYSSTDEINAFALGHRTIVVTRGIMDIHPEFLKGVLAHEFGHIANGDSDLKLGINVSNCILSIFMFLVSIIANGIIAICYAINSSVTNIIGLVFNFIFNILILGVFKLWSLLGVVLINWASRRDEYCADSFADKAGYGEQLAQFLYALDGNAPKTNKFSLMFQTHPDTVDRLENLGHVVN